MEMSPTNCGWTNVDGKLEPTWFVGNQLPEAYQDIDVTPDIFGDTFESEARDDEEVQVVEEVETNFEEEFSEDED
ncbi:hypothetical protein WA026_013263 [Henosepilachna vigintioctopunctata]|uniref:Uncharacterized protein n=1 Tax=Henosepilachna vigintioctopunctata TaxID=420089 RepID=A0AAW1UJR2_9CUCU